MPLDLNLVARTYPTQEGEAGTPYIRHNGRGRYFVVRDVLRSGKVHAEYARDPGGHLEAEATHLVRTHFWGPDDDEAWYPTTRASADVATFGQEGPDEVMSSVVWLTHVEANQREWAEAQRRYDREYTIDDYEGQGL
jgi:hypothetical protein